MTFVPEEFARAVRAFRGAEGEAWLRELPVTVEACAARWSLEVGPPFLPLYYNYVARADGADGARLVLKICFPDDEAPTEREALRLFEGRGAVRLVGADEGRSALLLERLEPGTKLSDLCDTDDAGATSAAASVMRSLRRPAPDAHEFPSVADWGEGFGRHRARFEGASGPLPARLFDEAETLFRELNDSAGEPVLLHGDLHQGNIISARREPWLAIDPKGIVGEAAYEVGALLRNPIGQILARPSLPRVMERRIRQLSDELGFGRERVRGWGLSQAMLAAVWSCEDGARDASEWVACAEAVAAAKV
ncbi:MAG TPA: aminoglycoside phosphotransferase family protein [Pyrinomonadaceae bacterium]|nr:aminoglycoside phosphotransferase family protein [Pyrinomonadaceae bacterium]